MLVQLIVHIFPELGDDEVGLADVLRKREMSILTPFEQMVMESEEVLDMVPPKVAQELGD